MVNTPGVGKKFPKRHTYSVTANNLRPEIDKKKAKSPVKVLAV
jgi:hypothetical protein